MALEQDQRISEVVRQVQASRSDVRFRSASALLGALTGRAERSHAVPHAI